MIFDQLKNASLYYPLGDRFKKALEYLISTDFTNVEPGKYEVEGENIFAIVQQYDTKPLTAGKWESHKKYVDIQFIVSGKEKIGYSHINKMIVTQPYNVEKDVQYLKGEGNFLVAEAGYFTILFPTDIHMPCIAINLSTSVKKVVIKVRLDSIESETQLEIEAEMTEKTDEQIEEIKSEPEENLPSSESAEETPTN